MAEPGEDPRHKFLEERVGTALGAKGSKHAAAFRKLLTSEEAGRSLAEFINTPDVARVFVAEGPKDLVCFDTPPPSHKKKVVYFLKLQKVALTAENIAEVRWGAHDPFLSPGKHRKERKALLGGGELRCWPTARTDLRRRLCSADGRHPRRHPCAPHACLSVAHRSPWRCVGRWSSTAT